MEQSKATANSASARGLSSGDAGKAGTEKPLTTTVLDIQSVNVVDSQPAVKQFIEKKAKKIDCDILVVGGGMGGVAAALQASRSQYKVCVLEETDWLGGQMTAQGVSALDENYLVETSGSTLKYQQLRSLIRNHYQTAYSMTRPLANGTMLNPGNCWVSYLSFEPKVAVSIVERLLGQAAEDGDLSLFYRTKAIAVLRSGKNIRSVKAVNLDSGDILEFRCKLCIDASELGDVLPLAGLNYRSGSESQLDTGEAHAPLSSNPENVQDFVYPFAIEFRPGENHTIAKPPFYERFKQQGLFSLFGYKVFERSTVHDSDQPRAVLPFWTYRRLLDRTNWLNPPYEQDLAMINWMANDLRGQNIIDKPAAEAACRLALAKALSLGFLYWLQTEAPRDDGGSGYPEFALRPEVMGTADGLSKFPYIRESRRIIALHTITEEEIAAATNPGARARRFDDAVAIGFYPIDIHGVEEKPGAAQATRPFQLPLSALIPRDATNLIAACKNIGTTHITNGAYRLHPVEWAAGEAAGTLAAFCLETGQSPKKIAQKKPLLRQLQYRLVSSGVPVYWFDDVPVWHFAFPAIQFLAITGVMSGSLEDLHFRPDAPITRKEAAVALATYFRLKLPRQLKQLPSDLEADDDQAPYVLACLQAGLFLTDGSGAFQPESPLMPGELRKTVLGSQLASGTSSDSSITRADFANLLYSAALESGRFSRL